MKFKIFDKNEEIYHPEEFSEQDDENSLKRESTKLITKRKFKN